MHIFLITIYRDDIPIQMEVMTYVYLQIRHENVMILITMRKLAVKMLLNYSEAAGHTLYCIPMVAIYA